MRVLKQKIDQEGVICWCEVPGTLNPIKFEEIGEVDTGFTVFPPAPDANGVQFLPGEPNARLAAGKYRIVVKGDFIRDAASRKGVDADHLPPWFGSPPVRGRRYQTGDAVAGGTFESWFTLVS